jgi:hypothetical protein
MASVAIAVGIACHGGAGFTHDIIRGCSPESHCDTSQMLRRSRIPRDLFRSRNRRTKETHPDCIERCSLSLHMEREPISIEKMRVVPAGPMDPAHRPDPEAQVFRRMRRGGSLMQQKSISELTSFRSPKKTRLREAAAAFKR